MKKSTNMKRRSIRLVIVAMALTGSLFLFISAASEPKKASRKESVEECCKKKAGETEKHGWKDLSRQFFSSI